MKQLDKIIAIDEYRTPLGNVLNDLSAQFKQRVGDLHWLDVHRRDNDGGIMSDERYIDYMTNLLKDHQQQIIHIISEIERTK